MMKKVLYVMAGFVGGLLFAIIGIGELRAQFDDSSASYRELVMAPSVPAKYGTLVAVSDMSMYFSAIDGTVTIVRPKTGEQLDTTVTIIKRR
jgi:hypothetical protein